MGWFSECTSGFAKYILFVFNFIILIAAIILIVFGIQLKTQNGGVDIMSVGSFTIAVAVLIALIAFFGCCGALREGSCMLTTYATICIILFIIQLVLGILAFVAIKNGNNELDQEIHKILDKLYSNITKNNDDRLIVEGLQRSLECCGRDGLNDPNVHNGSVLIDGCCKSEISPCTANQAFTKHCYDEMTSWVQKSIKGIGIVAIIFGAIELLSAIFACYVKNTRHD